MQAHEQVRDKVAELEMMLTTAHPGMRTALQTIHKQLRDDPEIVTILSDEERSVIVRGLKHLTKVELVASAAKSRTKSAKSITAADLGM